MKKKLLLLGVLAASFAAVGVANVTNASVSAQDETFTIAPTASVKLMETAADSGIRFSFTMEGDTFETLVAAGAEFGAIIAPADVAAKTALTWTNATVENSVLAYQEIPADKWLEDENGNYSTYAYLYGLPQSYYNRAISAVGVIQEGTTESDCTYTAVTTKSMVEVAVAALADTTQSWTEEEKALIGAYVLDYDVVIKDGETVLETVSVKYGTSLSTAGYTTPTKVGYIFDGFDGYDVTAPVTGDTTVNVKWFDVEANLGFDTADSVRLITSGGQKKPTLVDDEQTASGKAAQFTLQNTGGGVNTTNNITINLGSKYKVKDIESITVRYKIVETGTEAQWWRPSVNSFEFYDAKPDVTGGEYTMVQATYSSEGGTNPTQGIAPMSTYGTITITRDSILTYFAATNTGDENTVINDVRFWAQYQKADTRWTVFNVDSIVINEKVNFDTALEFNTDASLALVSKNYTGVTPSIVTETDGTKALEAAFFGGDNGSALTINIGERKVSEIQSLTVKFRFTSGGKDIWPRIRLGALTANAGSSSLITKNGFTNLKVGELKKDTYVSITWTNESLQSYFGSADAVVSSFTFIDESWRGSTADVCTVRIDSITMVLNTAA